MSRSALGLFVSLVFAVLLMPNALAAQSSNGSSVAKKHLLKKHASAKKHKTKAAASSARKHRTTVKDRVVGTTSFHGRHRLIRRHASYSPAVANSQGDKVSVGQGDAHGLLRLKANVAFVMDPATSQVLFEKNSDVALPIASITKLMTSLIVVEANQDMDEVLEVTTADIDRLKNTSSRLRVGARLTRANMLHIALMSSENRAASALGRNYPGGLPAFVAAMNAKAKELGMNDTHYVDSTGLSSSNVASARDLAKLIVAVQEHPILCQYSTDQQYMVKPGFGALQYRNSNHLVNNPNWDIMLQKTGYIVEAGRCLVMKAKIEGREIVMVLLDSKTSQSRLADASRVRKWIETVKFDKLTNAESETQG